MSGVKKCLAAVLVLSILFGKGLLLNASTEEAPLKSVWENRQEYRIQDETEQVWNILVPSDGSYEIVIEYQTVSKNTVTPQGEAVLTSEHIGEIRKTVDFPRVWAFADGAVKNGRFARDAAGNEIMPSYKERSVTQEKILPFADGGIVLKTGEYSLTLSMRRAEIIVQAVMLCPFGKTKDYKEYISECNAIGAKNATGIPVKQEAELLDEKSHPEIAVTYDRNSPSVSPNDPVHIRYNLLGGQQFGTEGQWVSWTADAPESGYYMLDFIYRASQSNGLDVRRRLFVDGKIPFAECESVHFSAADSFQVNTLGGNNPWLFYLTKGSHSFRMEVVLSEVRESLYELNEIVTSLNMLYTKITVLVGETPDLYRDYDLDKNIEGLKETLSECAFRLGALTKKLDSNGGISEASLSEAARTLESMRDNPRKIPQRMDRFRAQINTLADLMGSIRNQPMELDYFVIRPPEQEAKEPKSNFWSLLKYRFKGFFSSFLQDYSSVSRENSGESINVWVSAADAAAGYGIGRDQAQIVSRLAADSFTTGTGVFVNISLLDTATLMSALVSGKGPDAALFVPKETLANMYFRNALVDLSQMTDFDSIEKRFYESALISLKTEGKTYALPELQIYDMLFYRSDIFSENGLTPPDTWTDFLTVLNRLQKKGMQVGVPSAPQIYEMLLLQNGGSLYNENVSATMMTETASIKAFTEWTDLFTKHGVPMAYDGLNRFRTGQMPLVLAPASFYGQLLLGAPEILGQWEMAAVPGTETPEGINRTETCAVSGAAILEKSKKHESAFKFLDWWTQSGTQAQFAFEVESKIGVSARYFPAVKAAFDSISWTSDEQKVLSGQWEKVSDNPQSPANYFMTRNLNNAYRRVVYSFENPRDVIYRYGQMVDDELLRKRKELGLS